MAQIKLNNLRPRQSTKMTGPRVTQHPTPRRRPALAVLEAIDQCALAVGLYTEQEEVWLSEISRLNREDREKVRPLIENGILPALEAEGPAPFLTLRK